MFYYGKILLCNIDMLHSFLPLIFLKKGFSVTFECISPLPSLFLCIIFLVLLPETLK